jgi:hypothetical protein
MQKDVSYIDQKRVDSLCKKYGGSIRVLNLSEDRAEVSVPVGLVRDYCSLFGLKQTKVKAEGLWFLLNLPEILSNLPRHKLEDGLGDKSELAKLLSNPDNLDLDWIYDTQQKKGRKIIYAELQGVNVRLQ